MSMIDDRRVERANTYWNVPSESGVCLHCGQSIARRLDFTLGGKPRPWRHLPYLDLFCGIDFPGDLAAPYVFPPEDTDD